MFLYRLVNRFQEGLINSRWKHLTMVEGNSIEQVKGKNVETFGEFKKITVRSLLPDPSIYTV